VNLSDVMSHAGLSAFAEVGLAVSFLTFAAVTVWALRRPRAEMDAYARRALDTETPPGERQP
jgi:cbb3-type cytochrome oxidase subunit 3